MVVCLQGHGKIKFFCALAVLLLLGYLSAPSSLLQTHAASSPPLLRTSMKLSTPEADESQRPTSESNNMPSNGISFLISAPSSPCCVSSSSCEASPSILLSGRLVYNPSEEKFAVEARFAEKNEIHSYLHAAGKDIHLSELVGFCGHIYATDRNSGIVYEVSTPHAPKKLIPRQVLADDATGGALEVEWAAVKSGMLYLGGSARAEAGQWVATIDPSGRTRYLSWQQEYASLQAAAWLNTHYQTLAHEAILWSDVLNLWMVLPQIDERLDSVPAFRSGGDHPHISLSITELGSYLELHNYQILLADSEFLSVQRVRLESIVLPMNALPADEIAELRVGFTSIKFLPNSQDKVLVTLLTVEHPRKCSTSAASFLVLLSLSGEIVTSPIYIPAKLSFKGLEFL